ncbi:MAG: ion channel [Polynucleobacter sp.]
MEDLPNFFTLFEKVGNSLPLSELYIVFLTAIAMLVAHALFILLVGKIYQVLIDWADNTGMFWLSIPFYMMAVGIVFMTHIVDIIIWTYALIALNIFEVDINAFYFAGEMYTTVGYGTFPLPENWKILPIVVAFSGIFAASMSGAVLFNMIGQIIRKKKVQ